MKSIINYPVKVFTTGFIVLVFLSLISFQIRKSCESFLSVRQPDDNLTIIREPSSLVPDEFENDPNVVNHSRVSAQVYRIDSLSFGIFDYFQARVPGGRRSNVYFFERNEDCMYFDKKSGLIVHRYLYIQVMPDKRTMPKRVQAYVGPEGISETQDKTLGRFIEPIIDRGWIYRANEPRELIAYDKNLRRFFKVDFSKGTITKGPELVESILNHQPIQIGRLNKSRLLNLGWEPPKIQEYHKSLDPDVGRYPVGNPKPIIPTQQARQTGPYLPVLDKSGRIDLLDRESLEFVKNFNSGAGRLFDPESYIGSRRGSVRPKDLLDYDVLPLFSTTNFWGEGPKSKEVTFGDTSLPIDPSPTRIERKYLGMFVASLSRSGTGLALNAYNEKGIEITKPQSVVQKEGPRTISHRDSRVVYFRPSWISAFTVGKYLVENLHPPVLSLGSFYTAYSIDASAGHKALFLLPNSFIAMQGRIDYGNFMLKLLSALWFMLPSIVFSIWLATRISRNALVVGLSDKVRLYWVIGTLGFGLAAYITYRLTRPKITLVTCQNCGQMRRPDMDRCHRCKSKWFVPELVPPAWRVLDGTVQAEKVEITDESSIAGADSTEGAEEAEAE
jgi:hypothetical protein